MFTKSLEDFKSYNLGDILGDPEIGIAFKWITGKDSSVNNYGFNFILGHCIVNQGKTHPVNSGESAMVVFILSGIASFKSKSSKFQVKTGDIIYICRGEICYVQNIGDTKLEFISCSDNKLNRFDVN